VRVQATGAPGKHEHGVTRITLTRPADDGWLALRMAAWSVVLPLLRRVIPLRRLARLAWAGSTGVRDAARERQIVRLSAALPRLRLRRRDANCLERSLLAYRFLAQASANPALVVAVRRGEAGVVGHAWTTVDGQPVHESEAALREFVPFVEFGPGGVAVGHQPALGALPDRWK
jgi:Transglutaminase-like superfamily